MNKHYNGKLKTTNSYLRGMEELLQQVENYKKEIASYEASTAEGVEAFRIKYLGTKGLVKSLMSEMKNVPNEQKKYFGQVLKIPKPFMIYKIRCLLLVMIVVLLLIQNRSALTSRLQESGNQSVPS